jgi:hypothetical protein
MRMLIDAAQIDDHDARRDTGVEMGTREPQNRRVEIIIRKGGTAGDVTQARGQRFTYPRQPALRRPSSMCW